MNNIFLCIVFIIFAKVVVAENSTTTRLIISRYKEDIGETGRWLLNYGHSQYTIMNRGPANLDSKYHSQKLSENVGRESYVYLQYIIENYDNLATITVFGQADSLANPVFRQDTQDIFSSKLKFNEKNGGFAFLTVGCIHSEYGFQVKYGPTYMTRTVPFHRSTANVEHLFINLLERPHVPKESPNPKFTPMGCFAVTREAIHRNNVEYYKRLLKSLSYESQPRIGYFFERVWPFIFNSNCSYKDEFHCKLDNSASSAGDCPMIDYGKLPLVPVNTTISTVNVVAEPDVTAPKVVSHAISNIAAANSRLRKNLVGPVTQTTHHNLPRSNKSTHKKTSHGAAAGTAESADSTTADETIVSTTKSVKTGTSTAGVDDLNAAAEKIAHNLLTNAHGRGTGKKFHFEKPSEVAASVAAKK